MNSFGKKLTMTTFGESHGEAIGCILDGVPAGLHIDLDFIQSELDRRKPGKSKFETGRKEDDKVKILSGVFNNISTGTPISLIIYNSNQKSTDYNNIKDIFRPGHADYTYFHKYGIRDHRGGGRSSARETAARVAAGAIAKLLLNEMNISIHSGLSSVDGISGEDVDFEYSLNSEIFSLDSNKESLQKEAIMNAKNNHDSVGGIVFTSVKGAPIGLGEPLYYKLDAILAEAMMGINAVKGIEIGEGFNSSSLKGSENNDSIDSDGFSSNHSGGILGGISNGDEIYFKTYFKATPSIFKKQETIDVNGDQAQCNLKGRHDPCVAIRGVVVCEAMTALVIADMLLLNMGKKMDHLRLIYSK